MRMQGRIAVIPRMHLSVRKLGRPLALLYLLLASFLLCASHAVAQPVSPAVPVDGQIRVSYSGFVLNRATNTFDTGGGFRFTNAINPGSPQQFHLLQLP